MKEVLRLIKYALFALSAGLIELGSFTVLNEFFHMPYWCAYLIALILSVLWNFTLNRKYTFHSASNIKIAMLKVACYYVIFTPTSTWLVNFLTGIGWNEYATTILVMIINGVTEFLYQRFFVFGKSIDTNMKAKTN